jgi:hypothetical protein
MPLTLTKLSASDEILVTGIVAEVDKSISYNGVLDPLSTFLNRDWTFWLNKIITHGQDKKYLSMTDDDVKTLSRSKPRMTP